MKMLWIDVGVLPDDTDRAAMLDGVTAAGLTTRLLGRPDDERAQPKGWTSVAMISETSTPLALQAAVQRAGEQGVEAGQIVVVTGDAALAAAADAAGCRPMLVVDADGLAGLRAQPGAALLGKHVPAAADLETALRYAAAEAYEAKELGPIPFGPTASPGTATVVMPTRGDLGRILGLVVLAGTAIALAIAYFLQAIYQTFRFPRFVYWLTLQFLPDWGRGLLFLLVGVAIGVLASRALSGMSFAGAGSRRAKD